MSGGVRVTVLCEELVRIEYAPDGRFVDEPTMFAALGPTGDLSVVPVDAPVRQLASTSIARGSPAIRVRTGRFELEYVPDGEAPSARNMVVRLAHGGEWRPGLGQRANLGGTLSTLDGVRGPVPVEPGLLSRDGWHVIDDSRGHVLVDRWVRTRESVGAFGNTDWYLFVYGQDYAAALKALTFISGRVPVPRRSLLGSWYSRYWPHSAAEFRGIVEEYAAHGVPLDVMVLDMDWHTGGAPGGRGNGGAWTGWSWNRELIPSPEELLSWLHEQGLDVTLNLHPSEGVGPGEDRYAAFMRALGHAQEGSRVPFDAGDRAYMRALFEQVLVPLEQPGPEHPRGGVDFWWLDWQQEREVHSVPGLTNLAWLNRLFFEHTGREGERGGARGVSFSRFAGWGDHRYPIHFSGDAHTGWPSLAFQVEFTVTSAGAGCFFWSHDIGGHFGPRLEEATTRWVQFGALSAAVRLHSARSAKLDRRPWTYEPECFHAMRTALALRSRLMPTIYAAAHQCERESLPLLRPMYLAWPGEQDAYACPHQYTLGEDLLVAPIVSPGVGPGKVATRSVWVPPVGAGERSQAQSTETRGAWFDLFTGVAFSGGTHAIIAADLSRVPVFCPGGVPVLMRPATLRMTDPGGGGVGPTLVVGLFPGEPGATHTRELVEDDGVTTKYRDGACARTPVTATWSAGPGGSLVVELTIGPTVGTFDGQVEQRDVVVEVMATSELVSVGGQHAWAAHEPEEHGGVSRVRLAALATSVQRRLTLCVRAADQRALEHTDRARMLSLAGERDALEESEVMAIGAGLGLIGEGGAVRLIDGRGCVEGDVAELEVVDRAGPIERVVLATKVPLVGRAGVKRGRSASAALPPVKLEEPPLGVRATRAARSTIHVRGRERVVEKVLETKLAPVRRFVVAPAMDWDWRWSIAEQAHEQGLDDARFSVPARAGDKWAVDLRETLGRRGGLAYAQAIIISPRALRARLSIEASDKVELFLDARKVYSLDAFDSHEAEVSGVEVELAAGPNRVWVKASDGGGGWGFVLTIDAGVELAEA